MGSTITPYMGDFLFVGSYTAGAGDGIRVFRMGTGTGALDPVFVAGDAPDASFLALHPGGRFLYAVHELSEFEGESQGAVSAYAVNAATGAITLVNRRGSGGDSPCHVSIHPSGRMALIANYGGGSVAAFPLEANGSLGPRSALIRHAGREGKGRNPRDMGDPIRQDRPHAHCILPHPGGRWALAADLGTDRLIPYLIDASAAAMGPGPAAMVLSPGSGPRHLAFHPDGRRVYAINELETRVSAFEFDEVSGTLRWLADSPLLPEGIRAASYGAEVKAHSSGRFLYASNRGHDSIAIFAVDASGVPRPAGHAPSGGSFPRHFGIDAAGNFLVAANQKGCSLSVFRIEAATGALAECGGIASPSPTCVVFGIPG